MPYKNSDLTLVELDAIADYLGCFAEIDGDRMIAKLFCNITGDHLGTVRLA